MKFPDNTVQTTAAKLSSVSPRDAAEPRWLIGMEINNIPGSWQLSICDECCRVFDLDWYLNNTYDSTTGMPTNNHPQHHAVSVLKDIDRSSVPLIVKLHDRQPISWIRFHFYFINQQEDVEEYYFIELSNAIVVELGHEVEFIGEDQYAHMDRVKFIYTEIHWELLGAPGGIYDDHWWER